MNDVNMVKHFSGGISEKSSSVMTGIGGLYRYKFEEIKINPYLSQEDLHGKGSGSAGSIDIKSINRYYGQFGKVWLM